MAGLPILIWIKWQVAMALIRDFATGLVATLKPSKERLLRDESWSNSCVGSGPPGGTTSTVMTNRSLFESKVSIQIFAYCFMMISFNSWIRALMSRLPHVTKKMLHMQTELFLSYEYSEN